MAKKTRTQKRNKPPKAKRFTHEQADKCISELETLSVSEESLEFFKALIDGNKWMNEQLELGRLTIAKLRKLFQIQGSEKASLRKSAANNRKPTANKHAGGEEKASGTQNSGGKPKGHGRNSAIAYAGANVVDVKHPELAPGDLCPKEACGGRLYEMGQPGVVVRVSGAPLATATRYDCQKMRCSICETVYTAPLPEGVSEQKYDNNFVAMLMINKYFVSMPLYRQDRLQQYLGMPLPASTQWDLMVAHEGMLKKLYQALCQDAADGLALCYDDTSVKVLSEIKAKKDALKGEKNQYNCFTTGVVSLHEDHHCYLFMTNAQVAGAFIGDILNLRNPDLDLPIVMCDALSANIPQNISEDLYILSYCLVHARRQFYELPDGYDDLADTVIDLIGKIYDNESYAKGLSAQERLAYHQKHSRPLMTQLKTYLESQQDQFEPNSIAGNAIAYVLSRFTELSQFLHYAYAPLDTNIVERALKMVIQLRNACMFYKTLHGAAFASYVQSALYSAAQNDINPCDYMRALLDHKTLVIENPQAWLPWKYQKTLKQIQAGIAKPEPSQLERPD